MDEIFVNETEPGPKDVDKIIIMEPKIRAGLYYQSLIVKSYLYVKTGIEDKTLTELVNEYDAVYVKTNRLKNLFKWTKHPNIIVFDSIRKYLIHKLLDRLLQTYLMGE
ncbi:MAG: hypothetical protein ACLSHN_10645 [Eubacterium sp.]|uniref:hypothetical protein n=1 Tax=Eubacterium sp. TaxID=142586 RepID=UPI003992BEF5